MTNSPFRSDTRAMRGLSVVITALTVALALTALAGAAALRHIDLEWRHALADRWTVELAATDPAGLPDAETVAARLRAIPGVTDAHPIAPEATRSLLLPWLRDAALIAELPLPLLIDLSLDPTAQQPAVAQAIADMLPTAKLDDHGSWTRDLLRIAQTGEALGLGLFAAILLTMVVTVAAAARARLAVNRTEIRLLHSLGATDFYIVRQFQAAAFRAALVGAGLGAILAGGAIAVFLRAGPAVAPFITQFRLDRIDCAILAAVPVAAIALATIVAGLTARASARRLQ